MHGQQFYRMLELAYCSVLLAACTTYQVINANPRPVQLPPVPFTEGQRLDVGVAVFEPDSSADSAAATANTQATIQKAEGRYVAFMLRQALEQSGYWGIVRVIPGVSEAVDVTVGGRILESNGVDLKVSVEAWDATGRMYLEKVYECTASRYAYTDASLAETDPFQDLYHAVANDLAAVRRTLTSDQITAVRRVSMLRFAEEVAPYAFEGYLSKSEGDAYSVRRLPAPADPMMTRTLAIRSRERDLLRVFDAHYGQFVSDMEAPYRAWRDSNYEELRAMRRLERAAKQDLVLGSVAAVGGLAGAASSGNPLGSAASVASVVGGAAVIGRGVKKYSEADVHRDALIELADSFSEEVAPRVIEVEGRLTTLRGSAEAQFKAWRQLLRQLFGTETGLTPGTLPNR